MDQEEIQDAKKRLAYSMYTESPEEGSYLCKKEKDSLAGLSNPSVTTVSDVIIAHTPSISSTMTCHPMHPTSVGSFFTVRENRPGSRATGDIYMSRGILATVPELYVLQLVVALVGNPPPSSPSPDSRHYRVLSVKYQSVLAPDLRKCKDICRFVLNTGDNHVDSMFELAGYSNRLDRFSDGRSLSAPVGRGSQPGTVSNGFFDKYNLLIEVMHQYEVVNDIKVSKATKSLEKQIEHERPPYSLAKDPISRYFELRRLKEAKRKNVDKLNNPSVCLAVHPEVARYFGGAKFQVLNECFSSEWLCGLGVHEIYRLYSVMTTAPPPNYSLQWTCFERMGMPAPVRRLPEEVDPMSPEGQSLTFVSYPTHYSLARVAIPSGRVPFLHMFGAVSETVQSNTYSRTGVFDLFVMECIYQSYKHDLNECLVWTDFIDRIFHCAAWESNEDSMQDQCTVYRMNPVSRKEHLVMAEVLFDRTGGFYDMVSEGSEDTLHAKRYSSVVDSVKRLAFNRAIVIEDSKGRAVAYDGPVLDRDSDTLFAPDACTRVYHIDSYIHQEVVVEGINSVFANAALSYCSVPDRHPFFRLAYENSWTEQDMKDQLEWLRNVEQSELLIMEALEQKGPRAEMLKMEGLSNFSMPTHSTCSEQRLALLAFENNPVTCIMGQAGSGKSRVVTRIACEFGADPKTLVGLCFMNSHANTLRSTIGRYKPGKAPVLTIDQFLSSHSRCCNRISHEEVGQDRGAVLMYKDARRIASENERRFPFFSAACPEYDICPLEQLRVVIVDEIGTVSVELMARLMATIERCCTKLTRLVLCGDVEQLPSIGPGDLGRSLMYGLHCVHMEHSHRQKVQGISKLAEDIRRHRIITPISCQSEETGYMECTASWRAAIKNNDPQSPARVVDQLYRMEAMEYLTSMVICPKKELAEPIARQIDTTYLMARAAKLNPFHTPAQIKNMIVGYSSDNLCKKGVIFAGQKITLCGNNMSHIGISNGEVVVVDSIVDGYFVHASAEFDLSPLYKKLTRAIYETLRKITEPNKLAVLPVDLLWSMCDKKQSSRGDADLFSKKQLKFTVSKLARCIRQITASDFTCSMPESITGEIPTYRQQTAQVLEAMDVRKATGRWLCSQDEEVFALLNCSAPGHVASLWGLGRSRFQWNPLTLQLRLRCNDIPFSSYEERRDVRGTRLSNKRGDLFSEAEIELLLTAVLQGELVCHILRKLGIDAAEQRRLSRRDRDAKYGAVIGIVMKIVRMAVADVTDCGAFETPSGGYSEEQDREPCFKALQMAANDHYASTGSDVRVMVGDFLSFTVSGMVDNTGVKRETYIEEMPRVRFLRCLPLGAEEGKHRMIFIPATRNVLNSLSSAAAVTFHRAQSTSVKSVATVIPYGCVVEEMRMAVTRAEDEVVMVTNRFAMENTVNNHTTPRFSFLGHKLFTRCLEPATNSRTAFPTEGAKLEEIKQLHLKEVDPEPREGETQEDAEFRCSSHKKKHPLELPHNASHGLLGVNPRLDKFIEKMERCIE